MSDGTPPVPRRTPLAANGFDPFAAQRADPTQPMTDPYAMLLATLIERYPEVFGGMYFEGVAALVVQVLDRPDARELVALATEFMQDYSPVGAAPTVRAVTVTNPYKVLRDVATTIQADAAKITEQGARLGTVFVHLQKNVVIAGFLDTPDEIQARIVAEYAGPDVVVPAKMAGGHRRKLGAAGAPSRD